MSTELIDRPASRVILIGPEGHFTFLGTTFRAVEDFYVAYTPHFEIAPTGLTAIEEESTQEFRWMDGPGIDALAEPVYPTELTEVLPGLGERRYPSRPGCGETDDS